MPASPTRSGRQAAHPFSSFLKTEAYITPTHQPSDRTVRGPLFFDDQQLGFESSEDEEMIDGRVKVDDSTQYSPADVHDVPNSLQSPPLKAETEGREDDSYYEQNGTSNIQIGRPPRQTGVKDKSIWPVGDHPDFPRRGVISTKNIPFRRVFKENPNSLTDEHYREAWHSGLTGIEIYRLLPQAIQLQRERVVLSGSNFIQKKISRFRSEKGAQSRGKVVVLKLPQEKHRALGYSQDYSRMHKDHPVNHNIHDDSKAATSPPGTTATEV